MGVLLSCSLRILTALCPLVLTGCHTHNSVALPPVAQSSITSVSSVQQNPDYKRATVQFSKRNFSDALTIVDTLLRQPQYLQSATDHAFLLHQKAICRHAIDPHIAVTDNSTIPATVPLDHVSPKAAEPDCGPRALLLLCPQFGIHTNLMSLRQQAGTTSKGTTFSGLAHAATSLGLKAKGVQVDRPALMQVSLPAIAWYDGNHYIDLLSVSNEQAIIRDPNKSKVETISANEFLGRSGGILLMLSH